MSRDIFRRVSVRIAKQTLKMPDEIAAVAGGPNKKEAREILRRDAEERRKKRQNRGGKR